MATEGRDFWVNMPGPSVVTVGFDVLDRVEQAVAMVKERLRRAVADLDRLITMKLTAFGLNDRVDLRDMIDVDLIDAAAPSRLTAEVRPRLAQLLADPNG